MTPLAKALIFVGVLAAEVTILLTVGGLAVWTVIVIMVVQLALTNIAIGRPRRPPRHKGK